MPSGIPRGTPTRHMIRVVWYKQALPALVVDKLKFSTVEIKRYKQLPYLRSGIPRGYDPRK